MPTSLLEGVKDFVEERRARLGAPIDQSATGIVDEQLQELKAKVFDRFGRKMRLKTIDDVKSSELARMVIFDCLQDMQAASIALYRPSKTRTDHQFRISVRRLRHALNLFSGYVGEELKVFARRVRDPIAVSAHTVNRSPLS